MLHENWVCAPTELCTVRWPTGRYSTPKPKAQKRNHMTHPINDIEEVDFFSCVVAQFVDWLLSDCRVVGVQAQFIPTIGLSDQPRRKRTFDHATNHVPTAMPSLVMPWSKAGHRRRQEKLFML